MPKFDRLFITEKASVARALADYLSRKSRLPAVNGAGFLQVGNDVLTPMSGHLLELFDAHDYDPSLKSWRLDTLPIIPNPFRLRVKQDPRTRAAEKIEVIRKLLPDCTSVIGCGDPDAEGQLLQDELLIFLKNKKPVLRLWMSSLDDTSIERAMASMRPNEEYKGWFEAALSRSHADWIYGINMTRACAIHAQNVGADFQITIGRVQTPTLALVVQRENDIANFKPVDYYVPSLVANSQPGFQATWSPAKNDAGEIEDDRVDADGRLLSRSDAEIIVQRVRSAGVATVAATTTKAGTEAAPLPFSLSSLQSHCSRLYGLSASDTLAVAQSLYLKKLTTYPRVDCEYLPESQHGDVRSILDSISKAPLPPAMAAAISGSNVALKSKTWNDKKVTAHHAIIPAKLDDAAELSRLSEAELKVYLEILKRYVLQFWPVAKFSDVEIVLHAGGDASNKPEIFIARGRRYTDEGWRAAFSSSKEKQDSDDNPESDSAAGDAFKKSGQSVLPPLKKADQVGIKDCSIESKTTRPPERFTDGTLVSAMKNVHKYVQNIEYKKRLKESVGIGTEATRAPTIETLVARKLLVRKGKELLPSDGAMKLIAALPTIMKAPDMTAMWQQLNDEVQAGNSSYQEFMAQLAPWLTSLVKKSAGFFKPGMFPGSTRKASGAAGELTDHLCFGEVDKPGCGSKLLRLDGRYGPYFRCSSPECGKAFRDVNGNPFEKTPRPGGAAPTLDKTHPCLLCKKGWLQRRLKKDGASYFWGCSEWKSGCKGGADDVDGQPVERSSSTSGPQSDQNATAHSCPICSDGKLRRVERKDGSGYFWGCGNWRNGCKAVFNDVDGLPDVSSGGRSSGGSQPAQGSGAARRPGMPPRHPGATPRSPYPPPSRGS